MLPNISYVSTMNYVTSDFISCVLMTVEVGERCVEMIRVSGSETVTYLVNKANLVQNFSWYVYTYLFLYTFRATTCPPSGETTVTLRHLVFVTLRG